MSFLNEKIKHLIIALFVSLCMVIGIANMSRGIQQKSVLDFDSPASSCAISICSLL